MREIEADLWRLPINWICITTNGDIKKNNAAVMGRGCALEAAQKSPGIEYILGASLKYRGNVVTYLGQFMGWGWPQLKSIYSFPVKHHWRDKADLDLIAQSCEQLLELYSDNINQGYVDPLIALPRPGCGAGGLSWRYEVKPLLESYFKDSYNIIIVSKPGEA